MSKVFFCKLHDTINTDKKFIKNCMVLWSNINGLKFGYSEKDTKIWPIFHFLFTIIDVKLQLEDGPYFGGLLRISRLYTTRLIILLFSANFFFQLHFWKIHFTIILLSAADNKTMKKKNYSNNCSRKKIKDMYTHTIFVCAYVSCLLRSIEPKIANGIENIFCFQLKNHFVCCPFFIP